MAAQWRISRSHARYAMNSFPAARCLHTITSLTRVGSVSTFMARKTFLSLSHCFATTTNGFTPSRNVSTQSHPSTHQLKPNMKTTTEANQSRYDTASKASRNRTTRTTTLSVANLAAPNLTQRPPRSPRSRLGGYALLPRMLDKGGTTTTGTNGE